MNSQYNKNNYLYLFLIKINIKAGYIPLRKINIINTDIIKKSISVEYAM
jgi:hypothetical protein